MKMPQTIRAECYTNTTLSVNDVIRCVADGLLKVLHGEITLDLKLLLQQPERQVHSSRLEPPLGNAPGRAPAARTEAEELFSSLGYKDAFTEQLSAEASEALSPEITSPFSHIFTPKTAPCTCLNFDNMIDTC